MAMFNKTNETKVLRDPVHGYIHVKYQVIWDCINAKEFQRLHRIHQLGGDFQIYHTAEHSRFSHSLGVYEITRRMCEEVDSIAATLSEYEKIQVLCAALLHDLGHGPFSHFFETLHKKHHEQMTCDLILNPETEIHKALIKEDEALPQNIVLILTHQHAKPMMYQMISSQLDADRMDYLLRDAYETGTSYGNFDLERILRTLRVKNDSLCVKMSGMHSIEDYIMARYHMYWQVYLHPDAKSYEIMIQQFFKRYAQVRNIEVFEPLLNGELSNKDFYLMDEHRMFYGFQQALECEDEILKDFANRILNRHLFEWIEDPSHQQIQEIKNKLVVSGYDLDYCYYEAISHSKAYLPYTENDENQIIWMLDSKKELVSLSSCSQIVKALLKMKNQTNKRIYFPKEIL